MDNSVCINLNIVYKEYINNYIYNMYEPKLNVNNIYKNYLNFIMWINYYYFYNNIIYYLILQIYGVILLIFNYLYQI